MGGERAGKSFLGATYLTTRSFLGKLFWIIAWDYELCRPEFQYVVDQLSALGGIKVLNYPREGPCSLETESGIIIETKSGQDPRRIAGKAPDGIVGCEISLWPYELFLRVRGRLAETRGWFLGTGSFETSVGWLPEKFSQWAGPNEEGGLAAPMPTWTNSHLFPGGWNDPEIQALVAFYPEDRFQERFAGVPVPPTGRVFSEARSTLHVDNEVAYEPDQPVYLAIDPGDATAYAVLALQEDPNDGVRIIDEIYAQRQTHGEVITSAQTRRWWHDVQYAVMDIAGRQHHGSRSAFEWWSEEGKLPVYTSKVGIKDGIDRVRTFLRVNPSTGRPRLRMHSRVKGLQSEMGLAPPVYENGGTYSYRTSQQGSVVSDLPKDEHNHSAKALGYFLVHMFGHVRRAGGKKVNYLHLPAHVPTADELPWRSPVRAAPNYIRGWRGR